MVVRGTTKLTRKGQITVPAAVRVAMGLKEGESLRVRYDEETRTMSVESAESALERTAGMFKPKRPVSGDIYELVAEEKRLMHEGMAEEALQRDLRSRER